jgi:hypothetical protein
MPLRSTILYNDLNYAGHYDQDTQKLVEMIGEILSIEARMDEEDA